LHHQTRGSSHVGIINKLKKKHNSLVTRAFVNSLKDASISNILLSFSRLSPRFVGAQVGEKKKRKKRKVFFLNP
jgi:hypothetical protein